METCAPVSTKHFTLVPLNPTSSSGHSPTALCSNELLLVSPLPVAWLPATGISSLTLGWMVDEVDVRLKVDDELCSGVVGSSS